MSTATTLINGIWGDPSARREVACPADGTVVGQIGYGDANDATSAADAAAAAFASWSSMPARARGELLRDAADLIDQRAETIGHLLAREAGKRLPEAVGELRFSAEYFRWFAEEARRSGGDVLPHETPDRRHLVMRRPAGVVATLTPWNFPCSIQARKIAPALAAGCTVVARVSEKAPLAAVEMFRCLTDAGVPAGVVNLVHGPAQEVTSAYLRHPAVRVVSFTGSTTVGRAIMAEASNRVVRPLLELGGDAPFIVFEDADLEQAVEGAMLAKFRNTGQSCIGANRFLIHDSVYEDFLAAFVQRVDQMTLGDGLSDPTPDLSSCIDVERASAMAAIVEEAVAAGAKVATREFDLPGAAFFAPTLLTDVPDHVSLAREEVFGPVAGVFRFSTEQEALLRANNTEMGLAGYVYTNDMSRLWRMGEALNVGIVGVNNPLPSVAYAPMGGTKQSGLGREGGTLGIEEFEDVRFLNIGIR